MNINTNQCSAFEIKDDATFNVNITLADGSDNILDASSNWQAAAGLGRENTIAGAGTLTIGGTGQLTATGGMEGAGIGGADGGLVSQKNLLNIKITGGTIKAYGASGGAGIGGACQQDGSEIEITGGTITAYGSSGGAGIGGGSARNGTGIEITGGIVKAFGGYVVGSENNYPGAGIGGGAKRGSGGVASDNHISGNAIVFAASGGEYADGTKKEALQGFDAASQGSITGGITFTGVGTEFDDIGRATQIDWEEGEQYGNVTITEDITFPANFKITSNAALTVGKNASGKEATLSIAEGKKLTVEGSLTNKGVIDIPAENIECSGNGKITTLLNYDPQGGEIVTNDDEYITYQNASGVQTYGTMPDAERDGYSLDGWYSDKKGEGTKVDATSNVLLNAHVLYANWTTDPGPEPTPTPPGPEPTPTPPGPEPGPTPEPTPDPSVDPDGDGSSSKTSDPFMGGIALALLGIATTGAVLVRKRK